MVGRVPFLTDDHHFALAMVASRAAQLDHHIEHAIASLMIRQPRASKALLKSLGADRLIDVLEALFKDAIPEEEDRASKLISRIKSLRSARNDLLHQIWGEAEDGIPFHTSIRPFREQTRASKTAEGIEGIAKAMLECTTEVVKWQAAALAFERAALLEIHELRSLRAHSPQPSAPGLLGIQSQHDTPQPTSE
jgi:hypothetical protein